MCSISDGRNRHSRRSRHLAWEDTEKKGLLRGVLALVDSDSIWRNWNTAVIVLDSINPGTQRSENFPFPECAEKTLANVT